MSAVAECSIIAACTLTGAVTLIVVGDVVLVLAVDQRGQIVGHLAGPGVVQHPAHGLGVDAVLPGEGLHGGAFSVRLHQLDH
ncbi:hypothetical protein OH749_31330 (plasmid) [Streptomyces albidoflavus]|uniref:hypothetical protein n=1 Tax=Streptomyces albidoflavus TaxID=1886 RepID=UPI002F907843|nr:hypothetical protein OH749_31330 [Streptomyces albidoflavus]